MTIGVFKKDRAGRVEAVGEIDGEGIEFSNGRGIWRDAVRAHALIQLIGSPYMEQPFEMQIDGQALSNCRITRDGGSPLLGGIAFKYDPAEG